MNLKNDRDFEEWFLAELLAAGVLRRVAREQIPEDVPFDVMAVQDATAARPERHWFFDVKVRSVIAEDYIVQLGRWAELARLRYASARVVLITTGKLTASAVEAARRNEILFLQGATRDDAIGTLAELSALVETASSPETGEFPDPRSEALAIQLRKIPTGTPGWVLYQKHVGDILEYLFCPPLEPPIYENPDAARRNRRDLIFGNGVPDGFWFEVRRVYEAHLVVVDAKNYGRKLEKRPIIEIGHYLKSHGCGLFGIVVSRVGPGYPAVHAMRELWISTRKLVVALSDEDLIEMLRLRGSGIPPEQIVKRKIAQFRMAL